MSQSSGLKSPQSPQFELTPELKAVLGCLDVQLEQELTRYRRYRRRTSQATPDGTEPPNQQLQKAPDAIAIATDAQAASVGKLFEPKSTASGWETVVPGEAAPLAVASSSANHTAPKPNSPQPAVSFTLTPPLNGATPSQGYLESTEALIKSIEDRRSVPAQPQRSLLASLLTPVGILSMLLFLLSCAALSTVIFSATGRAGFGLERFFPGNAQTAQTNTNTPPTPSAPAKVETVPPLDSQSPNLAAKEFVQLDLDTLSHINPNPTPLPAPATVNSVPPAPTTTVPAPSGSVPSPNDPGMNNLSRELLPQPKPTIPAATVPVSPAPTRTLQPGGGSTATAPTTNTASAAAPKKATTPIQSQDGYYYVVIDYSDERSFEQAREVVPDAYVADFKTGKKIQLGALGNVADAKRLVEELQAQGIAAYYDIPTQN